MNIWWVIVLCLISLGYGFYLGIWWQDNRMAAAFKKLVEMTKKE